MWQQISDAARLELRRSHTALIRVDVWKAGRPVHTLDVAGGSVGAEAGRAVLRNLSATLVDPGRELTSGDVDDLLNPYDSELAVWRGVRVAGVDVWVPQGVFGLTGREVNGDGSVAVTGLDRAMRYQGPMVGPLAISAGTPIEQAIERLLASRNRGVTFVQSWVTGFTVGPLLFEADIDVWREAQGLAKSVGGWLYHDRQGGLVFASILPTSERPVARYADGGTLIEARRSEDSDPDSVHNVVVVQSAKANVGGIIRAVAQDDDPSSPTYAPGERVSPKTITSQHVGSTEQAQQMAATELVRELGRSETADAVIVPDPTLDPLDVVTIHRPASGLTERGMVVATTSLPLSVDDPMQIGLHRSIRAQNGQVLDVPMEIAA